MGVACSELWEAPHGLQLSSKPTGTNALPATLGQGAHQQIPAPSWKGCFPLIKEKLAPFILAPTDLTVSLIQQWSVFLGGWRGLGPSLNSCGKFQNGSQMTSASSGGSRKVGQAFGKWILNTGGYS